MALTSRAVKRLVLDQLSGRVTGVPEALISAISSAENRAENV